MTPSTTSLPPDGAPRRCAHIHPSGRPCGGYAVTASQHCFAHSPEQAEKRAAARRRGGQAGRVAVLEEANLPIRTIADVIGVIELATNAVLTGRIDTRVANAIGVLMGVGLRAIQHGELERRLEAIEAVLEPERAQAVAWRRRA